MGTPLSTVRRVPFAGVAQDARYGRRLLRRQPGFAAVTILTMALGIGATTMLFSVAYGVLLEPLPWPGADRLARVTETRGGLTGRVPGTVSNGTFLAWRDHPTTIEDIGGWLTRTATLTGAGEPLRVSANPTTPSLFAILRVRPLIGRLFRDGEGAPGQPGVVVLSYGLWQERFGGRVDVLGQIVRLDDTVCTIVGVMPRGFAFPDGETRAWTAWSVPPVTGKGGVLTGVIFRAIARLRPGVTPVQASAEATARARGAPAMGVAARALFGAEGPIKVSATPEIAAITADVRPAILLLLAAAALLLVAASANVAGLQLARATTRRREMAVRGAMGAGLCRIVRQLLVENALVGLSGGVAGLLLAAGMQRLLPSLLPAGFPRVEAIAMDRHVLSFAVAVSVGVSVACGLLPAWHASRVSLSEALAEDGIAPVGGAMRTPMARTRALIMAGQVAIACMLLIGAVLLTRSFVALIRADRGYDPINVLTAELPLPRDYPRERAGALLDAIVERLRAVPGVTHAAYGTALPFVSSGGFTAFTMRSLRDPAVEVDMQAAQRVVSPDYFAAMRLRLVAGRTLRDSDTARTPAVVVVNRSFARQYLGGHPVGVRIPRRGPSAGFHLINEQEGLTVVGVVDDMRQDGVATAPQPEVFASFKQMTPAVLRSLTPILVIRTVADPAAYVATLRSVVRQQAPILALDSVMTMEDRVTTSLATPRLYAAVLVWFAVLAVLIAGAGLFGVTSFAVAQRTREIGVRTALGARGRDIVSLVLRQAFWIVAAGAALGLSAALAGVRLLSAFLYGVGPHDAPTFVAVALVIALTAAVACLVPARRAARIDPVTALRGS